MYGEDGEDESSLNGEDGEDAARHAPGGSFGACALCAEAAYCRAEGRMENDDRMRWMLGPSIEEQFWGPDCGCESGEEHAERCERDDAVVQTDGEA